jgi:hypothetical protein
VIGTWARVSAHSAVETNVETIVETIMAGGRSVERFIADGEEGLPR